MAAAYRELKVEVANHRGTITLERSTRGNSITLTMSAEIKRALTQYLPQNSYYYCIFLTIKLIVKTNK
jgi:enoyl-CoA hydratase/carnithine racemase